MPVVVEIGTMEPLMGQCVFIDGNNLLHAMYAHAPVPNVGRVTMVQIIDRWARRGNDDVTLVFDGPQPREGLSKQMASGRVGVQFSAPKTADDLIVAWIHRVRAAADARVVTSDTAIRYEARLKKIECTDSKTFVGELYPPQGRPSTPARPSDEKPPAPSQAETEEWLKIFEEENGPDTNST